MTTSIPSTEPPADETIFPSGLRPADSAYLRPYVPRLVVEWLRADSERMHQELEATLVFVDISGFTALTERLARKGKVGAELMRDTLDGVFTALLAEAYDWGAGLLKWGGDALLLMFDGPDHATRACRAAWEMQATIDRVGRLHVSGGTVVLRMSVGIGTGKFHFFLAGSVHHELLIAGPAMTETLTMEAIADAGEIGISPAVVAALPASCIGPAKEGITLLGAAPDAERKRAPDVGDVSKLDIGSCIPVAARAHVLLKKGEPEHRTITAAFIDLMDTDRLLAELGPSVLARALDERIRAIEEVALQYEVPFYETDVGKSSVKALLTAGAPSSTGHDEERMLRTLRDVMDMRGIVPMRVGVNTGKVFTGDFGPPYRRAYRVFGDAINTAARVMAKAEAGQILSTEIVLERSRTIFETTPIAPFAAKGKSEPVRASVVGPAVGLKESQRASQPLLGREAELAAMLDAVEAARGGRAAIVEIGSEPGMGKTRLIEEVVTRAPDFRVIRTRCEEYESSTPYYAFRSIVRSAIGVADDADSATCIASLNAAVERVDASLVPWIPLLGILLGLDLPDTPQTAAISEQFIRERLAEVAIAFLGRSLSGSPSLFIVEDTQHLDEASHDLLLRIASATRDRRLVLIATRQGSGAPFAEDDDSLPRIIRLEVGPLPLEACIAIIEAATEDDPLPRHMVEEIAQRSSGNGLFLFELLDVVRTTGSVEALPDSIESMIAGDIDRLSPTDRTILRYAAVLGATFDPGLLAAAVAVDVDLDDEVWERLDALVSRDTSGALRFRNTLIRDAAYEGLPYRRRRVLHGRVGDAIEAQAGVSLDEEIATLALHFHEAQRWDKAWRFGREAGDRAMALYANVDAARFYDRALAAGRRLRAVSAQDLASIYERSADARYRLGEFDAADHGFEAARRLLGRDPIATAPLVVKQVGAATRTGQYRRALTRAQRALKRMEGRRGQPASAARSQLMMLVGSVLYLENRNTEAIEWCQQTIAEAKLGQAKDALAGAYKVLDLAYLELGEVERATHTRLALALYEELGDLRNQALILNNLGLIAHDDSRWDESAAGYARGLELAEKIGDRSLGALMKYNLSEILIDQGRYQEAEPQIREVVRLWRAAGAEGDVAEANREFGRLLARLGRTEEALRLLETSRSYQAGAGKSGEVLRTDTRIAEAHLLAGAPSAASRVIDDAERLADTADGGRAIRPMLVRLRGWSMLQRGRTRQAREQFGAAITDAHKSGEVLEEALALDALLAAGGKDDDLATRRDELFTRLGIVVPPQFPTVATA